MINHLLNLRFLAPSVRKYSANKSQQMRDVYTIIFSLILDKDNYKLSLELDAILGGLSIGQLRTCPVF